MGSTNGTYLNDVLVKDRMPVMDGDVVRVGSTGFRFELVGQMLVVGPSIEEAQTIDLPASAPAPAPVATTPYAPPPVSVPSAPPLAVEPVAAAPAPGMFAMPEIRTDAATVIEVRDVIKEFDSPGGKVRILKKVSLQVRSGEFVGVRGPSGSGKSTLLNMITGIDRPTSGDVVVAGQSLNKLSENKMARWRGNSIGVIFQFFQLLPTLTVIENIMLPMDFCRKWKPRERQQRAMALLEQVELAEHAYKLPSMLSGGQQQRAAIARAMANDPPLIVADEPTGNLDSKTADRIFMLFRDLVAHGTTFMMVTHDVELASRIPRVLEVRDGELYEHHATGAGQN
jgi:putative ABC transport system ATP-binding protein